MILVDIHHFPPVKTNLYTYQNAKKPRFVDNMVDNVDKRWWITHAAFVNNAGCISVFTHGKRVFSRCFLQEILPENPTFAGRFSQKTGGFRNAREQRNPEFLRVSCKFLPSLW